MTKDERLKFFKPTGLYTALITPLKDDELDIDGLYQLIDLQKKGGVEGLVIFGTTGEDPTILPQEKETILKVIKEEAKGLKLILGTGSYATYQTIENTKKAEDFGADAVLVVCPYYNKPTQEGLFRHFEKVASSTKLPIIIYNIFGRTASRLETPTLKRLAQIHNIVGIKESSSDLKGATDVVYEIKRKRPDFSLLSGDDNMTFSMMALGGDGVISVLSNLFPKKMSEFVKMCRVDLFKARELFYQLLPFMEAIFIETNPIPIKAMMQKMGLPSGNLRLPLTPLSEPSLAKIESLLSEA